ncbi:MAG: succinate dehydrogenase, hydrophobic membrane anchor protein [Planktomarina sp.]
MHNDKGTPHFRFMTRSSVVLLFLTPAMLYILIPLIGAPYEVVVQRLGSPIIVLILAAGFFVTLLHFKGGVQTVIEDYSRGAARVWGLRIMAVVTYVLMACSIGALGMLWI